MPLIRKHALFHLFEEGLRKSGASFLRLTEERAHPATYQVTTPAGSYRVRVYIWNLTPGGKSRPKDEWRIQPTGLEKIAGETRLIPEVKGKTAVLGWHERYEVFAAFDVNKHLAPLGASPSIQLREHALEAARLNGIAYHFKGSDEVAFAFKPAYLGIYLDNMEDLHACGSSEEALKVLGEICAHPEDIEDRDVKKRVPASRRYAVMAAKKALRAANFKERILTAYSNTCAMCGVQLRLLDAAHILPAAHPDSTDETSNGIALCALHHRAYDRGLVTFDTGYRIHFNELMGRELASAALDGGLVDFRVRLFPTITVPPSRADRPSRAFIKQVNTLRGWKL